MSHTHHIQLVVTSPKSLGMGNEAVIPAQRRGSTPLLSRSSSPTHEAAAASELAAGSSAAGSSNNLLERGRGATTTAPSATVNPSRSSSPVPSMLSRSPSRSQTKRPHSRSHFFEPANVATLEAVRAAQGGGGGDLSPRGEFNSKRSGDHGQGTASSVNVGNHEEETKGSAGLEDAELVIAVPTTREVTRWVSGGQYMRYDIGRPQTTPSNATLRACGRASGNRNSPTKAAGPSNASDSVANDGDPSLKTISTGDGEKVKLADRSTIKHGDGAANYTIGGDPNSKRRFNTLGVGITISASRGIGASATKNTGAHTSSSVRESAGLVASSSTLDAKSNVASNDARIISGGGAKPNLDDDVGGEEMTVSAARARLLQRRDQLQASLDARGSSYTNKIGKLTSSWLLGDRKTMQRKATTPPRSRAGSPHLAAHEQTRSTSPFRPGSSDSHGRVTPISSRVSHGLDESFRIGSGSRDTKGEGTLNSVLKGPRPLGHGGSASAVNKLPKVGHDVSREGHASSDMPSPSVIRQHLASSFAAVHLSPNSSTVIVRSPPHSPRLGASGSLNDGRLSGGGGEGEEGRFGDTVSSTLLGGTTQSEKALNGTARSLGGGSSNADFDSFYANHGYIKGLDLGAEYPVVTLKRSTSPPVSALHGGCTHNEQQQPRLFPALLGPYVNPHYYTRKGDGRASSGLLTTRQELQEKRDSRPVSPLRHGNALGVPSNSRPYSPAHDVVVDAPFRVCGSSAQKPLARQRPAAGPPQFLSPGTTSAAKRTYISTNPNAYH